MKVATFENPFPEKDQWKAKVIIRDDDHYVPAWIAGSDEAVFLMACHDGVPAVRYLNHTYLPARWVMNNFPEISSHLSRLKRLLSVEEAEGCRGDGR